MSKIYEALNRAELERGESDESIAQRFSSIRSPKAPISFPVGSLTEPYREPSAEPSLYESSIELSNVKEVEWALSLSQLPALEERGNALEQFRGLRSHLQAFRDFNPLKTVLVSSGLPQEGKSFVAVNLAISFARHKSAKVLLIDGDMRRSSQHKLLGSPSSPGLTEYLSGQANVIDILQRAKPHQDGTSLPKGISSLYFIPAGSDADNAADLSGSPRFAELLSSLAPLFDWIIVDSSPVNLVADGVNLARHCDAALLVARGGVTEFKTAQRALSELKASKVLGFVLNAVDNPRSTGGYYGYDSVTDKS